MWWLEDSKNQKKIPFFLPKKILLLKKKSVLQTKNSSLHLKCIFLYLNWSIVVLQYYINFCCIAKWFSYIYMCVCMCVYTYPLYILFNYGLSQNIDKYTILVFNNCSLTVVYNVKFYYQILMLSILSNIIYNIYVLYV